MTDASDNMMEVKNVTKTFGDDWEKETVVENLSFSVKYYWTIPKGVFSHDFPMGNLEKPNSFP